MNLAEEREIGRAGVAIESRREQVPARRTALVAVTGIDGAGKGHLTEKIVGRLRQLGSNAAGFNVDGWLNLPRRRFNPDNPAEHFYEHAIRFDEMFARLLLPLKENRSVSLVADFAEESATEYRQHRYEFHDLDILVVDGIYLLKRACRRHFDFSIWVDCPFETAMERALRRRQEGLSPADTRRAYETIYFPAQRIHLAKDNPRAAADLILSNDPRL